MNNLAGKRVLITGASSGIGAAMARALASRGCELYLLARRLDRLENLKDELGQTKVHLLVADVNDPHLQLPDVDILINNAGLALGRDKIETAAWSDLEAMLETNVIANFKVVHQLLPKMLERGSGDIINLCSIAGHYTYPGGAVYCATKHAVLAFTRALREETAGRGIRVMQISPGMVDTEFSTVRFKGDESAAKAVYHGMQPLTGEDIARMMVFMLEQPPHVVIDEIITMPVNQGSATTVVRK